MPRKDLWTEEEVSLLIELYPHTSTSEIQKVISKTSHAIKMKAISLGLRKAKDYVRLSTLGKGNRLIELRPWTPENEERLKLLWEANVSAHEIAKQLNRTVFAVFSRVRKLKLERPSRTSLFGIGEAERYFNGRIVERGNNFSPYDFIVNENGRQVSVNVKGGTSCVISAENIDRLQALGLPYEFVFFAWNGKIYTLRVTKIETA